MLEKGTINDLAECLREDLKKPKNGILNTTF